MKKGFALLLALVLCCSVFSACAKNSYEPEDGKKMIVATVFPIYDWLREIVGDSDAFSLQLLLDSGADLHSYQASAADIASVSNADLFVYVGGESDKWVPDALRQSKEGQTTLNLLEVLSSRLVEEEVIGSMQGEDEEEEEEGPAYDEHVWLSLKNAALVCKALCDAVCELDPAGEAAYKANLISYLRKLDALDADYAAAVASAKTKTLVFADRFPFRYLAEDYGLSYDAAFLGCSAETEASFQTIDALAKTVDELGLKVVFAIEGRDHALAETVVRETKTHDQEILILDSLQGVSAEDLAAGVHYLDVMRENLGVLKKGLE